MSKTVVDLDYIKNSANLSAGYTSPYGVSLQKDSIHNNQVGVAPPAGSTGSVTAEEIEAHGKANDSKSFLDNLNSVVIGNIWTSGVMQITASALAFADPVDAIADPFSASLNGLRKLLWGMSPYNPIGTIPSLFDKDIASINATVLEAMDKDETADALTWTADDKTEIPGLGISVGDARAWWDSKRDGKPSNFVAQALYDEYRNLEARKAAIGEYKGAGEYWVNNASNLVGSIGASVLTGYLTGGAMSAIGKVGFLGSVGGKTINLNKLNNLSRFKSYDKLSKAVVSFGQMGGETLMEGMQARDAALDKGFERLGGEEYTQGLDSFLQGEYQKMQQANPDVKLDESTIAGTSRALTEQYRQQWAQNHKELYNKIEKIGDTAYDTNVGFNSLNLLLNLSIAGKYLKNTRKEIKINPKYILNKEVLSESAQEFGEEGINAVSQLMAESKTDLGHANAVDFIKAWANPTVAEQGAWGALGGGGQTIISNIINARDKSSDGVTARYRAQQEVIKRYHDIENMTDPAMIDKHVFLGQSLQHTGEEMEEIEQLYSQGKEKEAKERTMRLFQAQAMVAFETGTTKSLVHLYEKLSENAALTAEQRISASEGLEHIKALEEIYNKSSVYKNAGQVYENRAAAYLLEKGLKEAKPKLEDAREAAIDRAREILDSEELDKAGSTEVVELLRKIGAPNLVRGIFGRPKDASPEISALYDEAVWARENLLNIEEQKWFEDRYDIYHQNRESLGQLNINYEELISNKTQQVESLKNDFYKTMAEVEVIGKKEMKKQGKEFDPFSSKAYEKFYMDRLKQLAKHVPHSVTRELEQEFYKDKRLSNTRRDLKNIQEAGAAKSTLTPNPVTVPNGRTITQQEEATNFVDPEQAELVDGAHIAEALTMMNGMEQVMGDSQQTFGGDNLFTGEFNPEDVDEFGMPLNNAKLPAPRRKTDSTTAEQWAFLEKNMEAFVEAIRSKTGNTPDFRQVVQDLIETTSRDRTETIYDFLSGSWERNAAKNPNKYKEANFEEIYNELFSPISKLRENFFEAENFGEAATTTTTEDIKDEETGNEETKTEDNSDEQGNLYDFQNANVLNTPTSTAAYSSHNYKQVLIPIYKTNDKGQKVLDYIKVDWVYEQTESEEFFNEKTPFTSPFINAKAIVHPDNFTEGTKLTAKIHPSHKEIGYSAHWKTKEWYDGLSMELAEGEKKLTYGEALAGATVKYKIPIHEQEDGVEQKIVEVYVKIEEGSDEYWETVPMVFTKEGQNLEAGSAFIHTPNWYHNSRFATPENKAAAIMETRAIRKAVRENGSVGLTITSKTIGTFNKCKIYDYNNNESDIFGKIPLRESNPQSHIVVLVSESGGGFVSRNEKGDVVSFDNDKRFLANADSLREEFVKNKSTVFQVMRAGTVDGRESYVGFVLYENDVQNIQNKEAYYDKIAKNIKWAIDIYMSQNDPRATESHKVAQDFYETTGYSLIGIDGLNRYLSSMIQPIEAGVRKEDSEETAFRKVIEKTNSISLETLPIGAPYIHFYNGQLYIGMRGKVFSNGQGKTYTFQTINRQTKLKDKLFATLQGVVLNDNFLGQLARGKKNVSARSFEKQQKFVSFKEDGTIDHAQDTTYTDFLMQTLYSDMKAVNIGTKEEPFYTVFVQPTIAFRRTETTDVTTDESQTFQETGIVPPAAQKKVDAKVEENKPLTADETVIKAQEPVKVPEAPVVENTLSEEDLAFILANSESTNGMLSPEERDVINSKEDLSKNTEELSASAQALSEEAIQRMREVSDRIPGLLPHEQDELVNVLSQHIFVKLGQAEDNRLTENEVYDICAKYMANHIVPLIIEKQKAIDRLVQIAALHPELKNLPSQIILTQKLVDKCNLILSNADLISKEVYDSVAAEDAIVERDIEGKKLEREEEDLDNEFSYSKSELEENVREQASSQIRRFLRGIPQRNENGTIKQGFLGFPVPVDINTLYNTLTQILADKPSNLQKMLKLLQEHGVAHPEIFFKVKEEATQKEIEDAIEINKDTLVGRLQAADKQLQNQFTSLMSKHAVKMKFAMYSYNRKTGKYSLRVWDTNSSSVERKIQKDWNANIMEKMTEVDKATGNYMMDAERAALLLETFDSWKSINYDLIDSSHPTAGNVKLGISELDAATKAKILKGESVQVDLRNNRASIPLADMIAQRKKTTPEHVGVAGMMDRTRVNIVPTGVEGVYVISTPKRASYTHADLINWLANIGITITPDTLIELEKEGVHTGVKNSRKLKLNDSLMFRESSKAEGLFGLLAFKLREVVNASQERDAEGNLTPRQLEFGTDGDLTFNDEVITRIARIEAKYSTHLTSTSWRDNGKTIYGFSPTKFMTDRVNALKDFEKIDGNMVCKLIEDLKKVGFSKGALLIHLLENNPTFISKFQVAHIALTAIKESGKTVFKDNGITKLSDADHELTKLALLQDMKQGELGNYSVTIGTQQYSIPMRMATMFGLTMSDKDAMFELQTGIFKLNRKENYEVDVATQRVTGLNRVTKELLYQQTVLPELRRAVEFVKIGTNIDGHEGRMLFFFPAMNLLTAEIGQKEVTLADVLKSGEYSLEDIEGLFKNKMLEKLDSSFSALVAQKLAIWKKEGFIHTVPAVYKTVDTGEKYDTEDEKGIPVTKQELVTPERTEIKYFDKDYLASTGERNTDLQLQLAAYDYTINYVIHNANMFMVFAGDPALYFKNNNKMSDTDYMQIAEDTFVNVGKRMAFLNAPGIKLADAEGNEYLELCLQDVENEAYDYAYLERILGVEGAKPYKRTKGTDGQEYTTWQEHLYVLEKMGRTSATIMDITPEDIVQARELFKSGKTKADLTEREKLIIKKVFQPMKPVYTGSDFDPINGVMRTVYVKTSSFPLIPQMTEGLELDNLRKMLERVQKDHGKTVRIAFQSGIKTGSPKVPMNIFDNETGQFVHIMPNGAKVPLSEVNTKDIVTNYGLTLSRNNFRIQQDVPFKTAKRQEDIVSMGTQMVKLMFGSGALDIADFAYFGSFNNAGEFIQNPKAINGKEALQVYQTLFNKLLTYKKQQLYKQLGLNNMGQVKNSDNAEQNAKNTREVAKRIQRILREEAITRGYPQQDIDSLEIDAAGNFIIPIWLLSNGEKLESLLNAIVEKRIAKIKFPGNSYVVGSEFGFKLKVTKENEIQDDIKNRIVWIDENAQNGLAANQVLVASKFRDKDGNIIDLIAKGYVIKKKENGREFYVLDKSKFDPDVLSMLNFRIPTSGHNSMSVDEIAGFLPFESADLMIVSRNKTIQKGIDFDIDKESAYQLWHTLDDTGKIVSLDKLYSLSTIDTILENKMKLIKNIKKNGVEGADLVALEEWSDDNEILEDLTEAEVEALREDFVTGRVEELNKDMLGSLLKEVSELKKIKEKLYHNEIIKLQTAVLSHPKMQKNMVKVLSTKFAEEQGSLIENLHRSNRTQEFSPLSDEYQKNKMFLGASGKIAVGAYSLDVVSHSLFQQASANGKPLGLNIAVKDEEGRTSFVPYYVRFGKGRKYESNGVIGRNFTLDEGRLISDVLSERQNIATDNEKLQVMGKVNLNDITLDADKILTMLGFDKGEDGNSISMLFLSQPIIIDYVNELRKISSNIAGFTKNKKEIVTDILVQKYGGDGIYDHNSEVNVSENSDLMTNEKMLAEIRNGGQSSAFQQAVLHRFLELSALGVKLRRVQTSVNVDSKGLGISIFESLEKIKKVEDLETMQSISNASALIGEYLPFEDAQLPRSEMINLGYIPLRNFYVKPNTVSGAFTVHSLSSTYNLWSRYFPYDSETINTVFNEIEEVIGKTNEANESEDEGLRFEDKQDILRDLKKYLFSSNQLGLFGEDVQAERDRLFMDEFQKSADKKTILHTKTSLAYYLRAVLGNKDMPDVIRKNLFLKTLTFDIQKNGTPSTVRFNNTLDEGFNPDAIYRSVTDLFTATVDGKPIPLIKLNGKEYTSVDLAQDLVAYAYLEGGIQEVIQFVKFVPVSYLKEIDFSRRLREVHNLLTAVDPANGSRQEMTTSTTTKIFGINKGRMDLAINSRRDKKPIEGSLKYAYSTATVQYIQHHPEKVTKLTEEELKSGNITFIGDHKVKIGKDSVKGLGTLQEFATKESNPPAFLSIYDSEIPKGQKKFQLFKYSPASKTYKKIPVYGVFGMSEYNLNTPTLYYKSLVNKTNVIQDEIDEIPNDEGKPRAIPYGDNPIRNLIGNATMLTSSHVEELIDAVEADTTIKPLYAKLLRELKGAIEKENIPIETVPIIRRPDGSDANSNGSYYKGKIEMLESFVKGSTTNELLRVYVHEVVHALTVASIDKYIIVAGINTTSIAGAPTHIVRLVQLYKQARASMGDEAFFQAFDVRNGLTQAQLAAYGGLDIKEFLAEVMTNPHFQRRMASIMYKTVEGNPTGKTLYQKFVEFVRHALSSLGINVPVDSITHQAILSTFELIEAKNGGILYANSLEQSEAFRKTIGDLQEGDSITIEYFSESKDRDIKVRTVKIKEVGSDRIRGLDNISEEDRTFLYRNIRAILLVEKPKIKDIDIWYGTDKNPLSNLAPRKFSFGGRDFLSVEQAYQSLKSGEFDQITYDAYIKAFQISPIGTKIQGKKTALTTDNANLILMKNLIYASIKQNPEIAKLLTDTGSATLTHNWDRGIWKTEFPRILMQLRYDIKNTDFMSKTETFTPTPLKTTSELGTIELTADRIKFPDSATRRAKVLTENFVVREEDRLSDYWDASSLWEDLGVTSSEVREGEAFPLTAFAKDLMTKFEEENGASSERSLEDWKAFVSEMLKLQELWHKQDRNPLTKVLDSWFNYFEAEDSLVIFKELFSNPNMSIKQLRDFINGKLRYNIDDETLIEFQNTMASAKEDFNSLSASNQLSLDFDNLPDVGHTVKTDHYTLTITSDGRVRFANGVQVTDPTILNKVHLETQFDANALVEYNGYNYYVMPDNTIVSHSDLDGNRVKNYGKEAYANSKSDRDKILSKYMEGIDEVFAEPEIETEISEARKLESEMNNKYGQAILKLRDKMIEYTKGQREALVKIQDFIDGKRKYFLLAGYAGTGKTTIVENIVKYLNNKNIPVVVLAPTNKAVTVLKRKLSQTNVSTELATIHRIIYEQPDPKTGEWIPKAIKEGTTYLIDESSMINKKVLEDMMNLFTEFNCKAIFIGDGFQLEPIDGDPNLFAWNDREFNKEDQYQLTEVKRQEKGSILSLATFIRTIGKALLPNTSEGGYHKLNSEREMIALWQKDVQAGEDVILITSTNPARIKYNKLARFAKWGTEARNVLNDGEQLMAVNNSGSFSNGESFQITNYEETESFEYSIPVPNKAPLKFTLKYGEVLVDGIPQTILFVPDLSIASLHGQQLMYANTGDNRLPEELIDRSNRKPQFRSDVIISTYGYAITAHKSQGSEWKKVYLDSSWMADSWNGARWLYTAVTRASQELFTFPSNNIGNTTFEQIEKTINLPVENYEKGLTEYEKAVKEASASPNTTNIPQNLQSGVEQYGTLQEANNKVKATLGPNPRSIDMIETGFRTRTTRTVKELEKYNIKEGSYTTMFGTSANGKTKNVLVKITKITMGTDEATWYKEGWTQEGFAKLSHINSPVAIEFEVVRKSDGNQQIEGQSLSPALAEQDLFSMGNIEDQINNTTFVDESGQKIC